jgi:hypothetical protein
MPTPREELRRRLDAVESAYESASRDRGKIRGELGALAAALDGLAEAFESFAGAEAVAARDQHRAFNRVLLDDAGRALAAVRLVEAQPAISSQLVDNLNASLHVRALLTDVFLVDEILDVLGSSIPAARAVDPASDR